MNHRYMCWNRNNQQKKRKGEKREIYINIYMNHRYMCWNRNNQQKKRKGEKREIYKYIYEP